MTSTPSAALAEAARSRVADGHNETCAAVQGVYGRQCDCGHDRLRDALARYDAEQAQQQKEKESKS